MEKNDMSTEVMFRSKKDDGEIKAIQWMKNIRDHTIITLERIAKNEPNVNSMLYVGRKGKAETIIKIFEELEQYRAIGTVKECQKTRERQNAKKVRNRKLMKDFNGNPYSVCGDCPNCGKIGLLSINTDYCNACGQKLDWNWKQDKE